MKRTLWPVILAAIVAFAPVYSAHAVTEGVDYAAISPPVPTSVPEGKVEVVEMFWYGCPHCYDLEPFVQNWLKHKPANVEFVRIPAVFSSARWRLHARAFYTAEVLGVLDRIHGPLFDAIHKHDRRLNSEEELAEFFAEQGVSPETFKEAFNSFAVEMNVRRATDLTRRYGIDGVPVFIVDGKYRVTGSLAKSYDNMLRIVNELAKKQAQPASAKR